jgi:hypothetical protein
MVGGHQHLQRINPQILTHHTHPHLRTRSQSLLLTLPAPVRTQRRQNYHPLGPSDGITGKPAAGVGDDSGDDLEQPVFAWT